MQTGIQILVFDRSQVEEKFEAAKTQLLCAEEKLRSNAKEKMHLLTWKAYLQESLEAIAASAARVAVDFAAGGDPAAAAIEAARLLAAESDKVLEVTRAFTSTNLKTSH